MRGVYLDETFYIQREFSHELSLGVLFLLYIYKYIYSNIYCIRHILYIILIYIYIYLNCCSKLLQTWCLTTTESCSLTVLEAKIWQDHALSGDSVGESISCLSVSDGSRCSLTCRCIPPISASVVMLPPTLICQSPSASHL